MWDVGIEYCHPEQSEGAHPLAGFTGVLFQGEYCHPERSEGSYKGKHQLKKKGCKEQSRLGDKMLRCAQHDGTT